MILGCDICILHEHRNGHRSDSSRNRTYETRGLKRSKICISAYLPVHERESDVDNRHSWANHLFFDEIRASCCDDNDICSLGELSYIPCIFAAHRNGSSGIHEEEGKWLPDDIALSYHDNIFSLDFDFHSLEETHDSFWSTRNEIGGSEKHFADILARESIDIFFRANGFDNSVGINVAR